MTVAELREMLLKVPDQAIVVTHHKQGPEGATHVEWGAAKISGYGYWTRLPSYVVGKDGAVLCVEIG